MGQRGQNCPRYPKKYSDRCSALRQVARSGMSPAVRALAGLLNGDEVPCAGLGVGHLHIGHVTDGVAVGGFKGDIAGHAGISRVPEGPR